MTDQVEEGKIIYAIRLRDVADENGNMHEVYIEVSQLETMGQPFDLTNIDDVYIMACAYAQDYLGFYDASQATVIEILMDRPEGT